MLENAFGQVGFLGSLILYAALQGFVLAAYLVVRGPGDRQARWLLVTMVSLMSLHLVDLTLSWTDVFELAPRLFRNSWPLLFVVGPLFWLSVRRLVAPQQPWRWRDALHLLPALIVASTLLEWYRLPVEYRLQYHHWLLETGRPEVGLRALVSVGFNVVQNLVYLLLSRRLIARAGHRLAAVSADGQVLGSLRSLQLFVAGFTVWEGCYLLVFLALAVWGKFGATIDSVWLFISGLFLQFSALLALSRPDHFAATVDLAEAEAAAAAAVDSGAEAGTDAMPDAGNHPPAGADPDKYRKSSLGDKALATHRQAFERLMSEEKPYLDGSLRLADLAAQLGITNHQLSQVLNQALGASFFDVVNGYRVDEVMRLLRDPAKRHLSLLAVAFEAGFNNKNSFNRAFKAKVGMTPSAYLKSVGDD